MPIRKLSHTDDLGASLLPVSKRASDDGDYGRGDQEDISYLGTGTGGMLFRLKSGSDRQLLRANSNVGSRRAGLSSDDISVGDRVVTLEEMIDSPSGVSGRDTDLVVPPQTEGTVITAEPGYWEFEFPEGVMVIRTSDLQFFDKVARKSAGLSAESLSVGDKIVTLEEIVDTPSGVTGEEYDFVIPAGAEGEVITSEPPNYWEIEFPQGMVAIRPSELRLFNKVARKQGGATGDIASWKDSDGNYTISVYTEGDVYIVEIIDERGMQILQSSPGSVDVYESGNPGEEFSGTGQFSSEGEAIGAAEAVARQLNYTRMARRAELASNVARKDAFVNRQKEMWGSLHTQVEFENSVNQHRHAASRRKQSDLLVPIRYSFPAVNVRTGESTVVPGGTDVCLWYVKDGQVAFVKGASEDSAVYSADFGTFEHAQDLGEDVRAVLRRQGMTVTFQFESFVNGVTQGKNTLDVQDVASVEAGLEEMKGRFATSQTGRWDTGANGALYHYTDDDDLDLILWPDPLKTPASVQAATEKVAGKQAGEWVDELGNHHSDYTDWRKDVISDPGFRKGRLPLTPEEQEWLIGHGGEYLANGIPYELRPGGDWGTGYLVFLIDAWDEHVPLDVEPGDPRLSPEAENFLLGLAKRVPGSRWATRKQSSQAPIDMWVAPGGLPGMRDMFGLSKYSRKQSATDGRLWEAYSAWKERVLALPDAEFAETWDVVPDPSGTFNSGNMAGPKAHAFAESIAAEFGVGVAELKRLITQQGDNDFVTASRKQAFTVVTNLATEEEQTFSLPPDEAVVAAYEQALGNYNTWDYPKPQDHPSFVEGAQSVACGDWAVLKVTASRSPAKRALMGPFFAFTFRWELASGKSWDDSQIVAQSTPEAAMEKLKHRLDEGNDPSRMRAWTEIQPGVWQKEFKDDDLDFGVVGTLTVQPTEHPGPFDNLDDATNANFDVGAYYGSKKRAYSLDKVYSPINSGGYPHNADLVDEVSVHYAQYFMLFSDSQRVDCTDGQSRVRLTPSGAGSSILVTDSELASEFEIVPKQDWPPSVQEALQFATGSKRVLGAIEDGGTYPRDQFVYDISGLGFENDGSEWWIMDGSEVEGAEAWMLDSDSASHFPENSTDPDMTVFLTRTATNKSGSFQVGEYVKLKSDNVKVWKKDVFAPYGANPYKPAHGIDTPTSASIGRVVDRDETGSNGKPMVCVDFGPNLWVKEKDLMYS